MGLSRRLDMPLRRIVFDAVVVGLVVAMVIARLRSASGTTRVLKPVQERSPWRDLRERLLNLQRGVLRDGLDAVDHRIASDSLAGQVGRPGTTRGWRVRGMA